MQYLHKSFLLQISDFSVTITNILDIPSNFEYYQGKTNTNLEVLVKLFPTCHKESYEKEKYFLLSLRQDLPIPKALSFKSYENFSIIIFEYQENFSLILKKNLNQDLSNLLLNLSVLLMSFHKLGLVHCNISSESIFLSKNSDLTLGNLSNYFEESDPNLLSANLSMLESFLPPEFTDFNLNPCADSGIDIWMTGILLFQIMFPLNSSYFFKTNLKGEVDMRDFRISQDFLVIFKKILNWHPLTRASSFEVFVFLMDFFPPSWKEKKEMLKNWKFQSLLGGDLKQWLQQLFLNDEYFEMQVYLNKVAFYINKNKQKFLKVLKMLEKLLEKNDFRSSVKFLMIILQIFLKFPEEMMDYSISEDFFLFWHSNQCQQQQRKNMEVVQSIFQMIDRKRQEILMSKASKNSNNHYEALNSLQRRTVSVIESLMSDLRTFKVLKSSLFIVTLEQMAIVIKQLENFNNLEQVKEYSQQYLKFLQIYQFHVSIHFFPKRNKPKSFLSDPFPENKYLLPSDITGTEDFSEEPQNSTLGIFNSTLVFINTLNLNFQDKTLIKCLLLQSKVSHPNLLKFQGLYLKNEIFLVYENCEGGNLYKLLHSSRIFLSNRKKMQILIKIARGLKELHLMNLVYLGLSSFSVLFPDFPEEKDEKFEVKLAGLHKISSFSLFNEEKMKKYLPWLPPEFVNGQEVEFRSDSYSFGVVLWELFTGKKPFEDVDLSNLFDVGRKAFPLDPSLIEVDVARFLFERCLQEQVSERPSSEEILKALEVNQIGFF